MNLSAFNPIPLCKENGTFLTLHLSAMYFKIAQGKTEPSRTPQGMKLTGYRSFLCNQHLAVYSVELWGKEAQKEMEDGQAIQGLLCVGRCNFPSQHCSDLHQGLQRPLTFWCEYIPIEISGRVGFYFLALRN